MIYDRPVFLLFNSSDKRMNVQEMRQDSPVGNDQHRWQLVARAVGA